MAVVIEDVEQQIEDAVSQHPAASPLPGRLPATCIVLVPFSLGEVELVPDDE